MGHVEIFHIRAPTNAHEGNDATRMSAPIERVHNQLLFEAPLVSGFTCWEWWWYLSPTGGVQVARAERGHPIHAAIAAKVLAACTIPAVSAPANTGSAALATLVNVPANPLTAPRCFRGAELFRIRLTPPITTGPMHPRPSANATTSDHVAAAFPARRAYHARGCAR